MTRGGWGEERVQLQRKYLSVDDHIKESEYIDISSDFSLHVRKYNLLLSLYM